MAIEVRCCGEVIEESEMPLGEVLHRTREMWMEEPEGPQCFVVSEVRGWQLAVMLRDQCDPEVCHTLYADGTVEHHRCHYVTGPDGYYLRTEVTELVTV